MCLQRGLSDPAQLPVTEVEDSSARTRIQIQTSCERSITKSNFTCLHIFLIFFVEYFSNIHVIGCDFIISHPTCFNLSCNHSLGIWHKHTKHGSWGATKAQNFTLGSGRQASTCFKEVVWQERWTMWLWSVAIRFEFLHVPRPSTPRQHLIATCPPVIVLLTSSYPILPYPSISCPTIPLSYPTLCYSMIIIPHCTVMYFNIQYNSSQYHTIQNYAIWYYTILSYILFYTITILYCQHSIYLAKVAIVKKKRFHLAFIKGHNLPTRLWHQTSCKRCGCFFAPPADAKHHWRQKHGLYVSRGYCLDEFQTMQLRFKLLRWHGKSANMIPVCLD